MPYGTIIVNRIHYNNSRKHGRRNNVTRRQVLWNEAWSFTKNISLPEENWEQVTLPHSRNALDQEGRFVFRFQVPISGSHSVEAVSGSLRETITIRKADAPNPACCGNISVQQFAEHNGKPEHEALLKACQEKLRTIIKL